MNTVKLLQRISAAELTVAQVADKLGISRQGLYLKLNGSREFRASELKALKRLLDLSPEDATDIFFGGDVYEKT